MKAFDQGNEWLKFWNENQKSLFLATLFTNNQQSNSVKTDY